MKSFAKEVMTWSCQTSSDAGPPSTASFSGVEKPTKSFGRLPQGEWARTFRAEEQGHVRQDVATATGSTKERDDRRTCRIRRECQGLPRRQPRIAVAKLVADGLVNALGSRGVAGKRSITSRYTPWLRKSATFPTKAFRACRLPCSRRDNLDHRDDVAQGVRMTMRFAFAA